MPRLAGISLTNATAYADIRAVYGGLASARVFSYLVAGFPSPLGRVVHAAELVALALGIVAWRRYSGLGADPLVKGVKGVRGVKGWN